MTTVTIEKAGTDLAKLVSMAEAGEEIIITRNNTPVAQLVPLTRSKEPRQPGALKGKLNLPDEFFFDPLPNDELERWWGEGRGGQ
jgi:prevent-host-death family protein